MRIPLVVDTAERLLGMGGPLQSTGSAPVDEAAIERAIAGALEKAGATEGLDLQGMSPGSIAHSAVDRARMAVSRIRGGDAPSSLDDADYAALQVIVHVIGRPAIGFRRDVLDEIEEGLGENERWIILIGARRTQIEAVSKSIGRVTVGAAPDGSGTLGTAWLAAPGIAVTNRHVVRHLVADPDLGVSSWRLSQDAVVDFGATRDAEAPRPFRVESLLYCAPEEDVDLAVLGLASAGGALPAPIPLDFDEHALGRVTHHDGEAAFDGSEVYLVGHPYEPVQSTPIELVFRRADGLKRMSPGMVKRADAGSIWLQHDCSTLGGHSGAAVLSMDHRVIGVHVGGLGATATLRGDANVAVALCRIQSHAVVRLLQGGSS